VKVDNKRGERNPDMFAAGVAYWNVNDSEMDELMLFLATYVRNMHSDRYFKNVLTLHPGATYLDIITPSDIAYTCSLIRNSSHVWLEKMSDDAVAPDKAAKPYFTSGKGTKRTFGVTTWNEKGIKYFEEWVRNWMRAYKNTDPHYKILRDYWDKWIETKGKDIMVKSRDGLKMRTIHSILRVREEGEGQGKAAQHKNDEEEKEEEDVTYDSDPYDETIDIGNWRNKRGGRLQLQHYDNGEGGEGDDDDDNNNKRRRRRRRRRRRMKIVVRMRRTA